jgi:ketopantoate hydroxymethyltransferase
MPPFVKKFADLQHRADRRATAYVEEVRAARSPPRSTPTTEPADASQVGDSQTGCTL